MPDPYAAYGGQSTQPTGQSDPYAAYGGQATTTTTPAAAPPSLGDVLKDAFGVESTKGEIKGAAHTVAGLMEAAGGPTGTTLFPGAALAKPLLDRGAQWIRAHTIINNPEQQAGNIGETVAEFMALPELKAEQILSIAGRYASAAKLAKYLEESPKALSLMRIGLNTVKGVTEQGEQTYLKTHDVGEAAKAGAVGGLFSGALSSAAEGYQAIRQGLSDRALAAMPPPPRTIAGEEFPTTPEGKLITPEGQQRAATERFEAAGQNLGQAAVKKSLDRANLARPVGRGAPPNPARLLPAEASPVSTGETPDVGTLTVQGTPPVETVTQPSQEGSRIYGLTREVPNPAYEPVGTEPRGTPTEAELRRQTVETQAVPTRSITGEPTITVPNWQEIPPPTGGGSVVRGGGGPIILTADGTGVPITKARAMLNNYETMLDDPEIGERAWQSMNRQRADLAAQVERYDNYVAGQQELYRQAGRTQTGMYQDYLASEPNFPIHDVDEAMRNTTGLQSAGQNIMDAHRPVFIKMDQLTDGEFGLLAKRAKGLAKVIRDPAITTTDRVARLDDLQQINDRLDQLFQQNRTQFTPQEWKTARDGYRDGAVLNQLGSFVEGHMGGITADEAARNANLAQGRIFKPRENFNAGLEKIYSKNRDVLERTIGKQGMDDLKQLGLLYKTPEDAQQAAAITDSISSAIRRHWRGVRGIGVGAGESVTGYAIGHIAASALGLHALPAGLALGTVAGTRRYIIERIASDPAFARRFIYATANKVSPRVAGPLFASRILGGVAKQAVASPTPQPQGMEKTIGNALGVQ